ncbi:MAG: TonB-dependent receptor [Mediterranea sp.]|jgi:outer membrane receptor protein involved in Fe transport|nr:TonB-dependent receptor [Mediterranea sp.]
MRKLILFILLLLCGNGALIAQSQSAITGKVVDESNSPLEFVNVVLLQKVDSAFVSGVTTGTDGTFSIALAGALERYLLRLSFVGYETAYLTPAKTDMGTVTLAQTANRLTGVEVVAAAPRFKMGARGVTASIQNTQLSGLATTMDVLGQLPFVNAKDGGLTVFGKGAPIVYINGRRVYNDADLSRLSPADIKEISVIMNPGAEYPSDVKSVIKIVTVKKQGEGISGYVRGAFTKNSEEAGTEQVNLTYQRKGLEVDGGLYLNQTRSTYDFDTHTTYDNIDARIANTTKAPVNDRNVVPYGSVNYTWKEHSVGAKFQHSQYTNKANRVSELDVSGTDVPAETQQAYNRATNAYYRDYANAYYDGKLAAWLSAKWDVDFAYGHTDSNQDITNQTADITENILTGNKMNYHLLATKLTLNTPLWKGEWTYGADYSYTNTRQRFATNDAGEDHYLSSSQTTIKQDALAFFAQYEKSFGHFSAAAGLRYERIIANYYEGGQKVDGQSRTYHDWLPNASLSYANGVNASLSYSRAITRPSYYDLRSSTEYNSTYMFSTGNPYLMPMLNNAVDLLLQWKDFQASAYYYWSRNSIENIQYQHGENPAVVFYKSINLKHSQYVGASVSYTPTIGIWKPALECSVEKSYETYEGRKFNKPIYDVRLRNSLSPSRHWTLGVDANAYTSGHRYLAYNYGMFRLDAYVSARFLDNALTLNLRGNNILNTEKVKNLMAMDHIFSLSRERRDTQSVTFSIAYRFNATKSKYKGEQASGEINRL